MKYAKLYPLHLNIYHIRYVKIIWLTQEKIEIEKILPFTKNIVLNKKNEKPLF